MAVEASVKNQVCAACGADVRPGSVFCYNCGAAIAENEKEPGTNGKTNDPAAIVKPGAEIGKPIGKPVIEPVLTANKDFKAGNAEPKKQVVGGKETVLQTAASVRKQAKPTPKKNVEVVWEQPENSVNILFIAATLVLVILAVGALMAMLYLR